MSHVTVGYRHCHNTQSTFSCDSGTDTVLLQPREYYIPNHDAEISHSNTCITWYQLFLKPFSSVRVVSPVRSCTCIYHCTVRAATGTALTGRYTSGSRLLITDVIRSDVRMAKCRQPLRRNFNPLMERRNIVGELTQPHPALGLMRPDSQRWRDPDDFPLFSC